MYKKLTAEDYRKHFKLPDSYKIEGFIVYGTYKNHPFEQFEDSLKRSGYKYSKSKLEHDFFGSLMEFEIEGKKYWLAIAYGGALLSEYLHLACLFGSRQNILIGSCGGLKKGASSLELIVPDWSAANESSATAYQPETNGKYDADKVLSDKLSILLSEKYKVYRGATVTFQAMLAETWGDIQSWASQGFIAVEMEAATVFAVSGHFNVPSAAILMIGDNLIEEQTVVDVNYESARAKRRQTAQDAFDAVVKALLV
jgi:purine-nucleoside phosphorylase